MPPGGEPDKVFHAALLLVISLESTPVHSISTITSRAASAGSIQSAAKIHIISAKQTNTSSRISLRDSLPSFPVHARPTVALRY